MLQLRNLTSQEPIEHDDRSHESRDSRSADLQSDDEGSVYGSDNEGPSTDGEDERLLVRSTISRDTTQNIQTVDSIDLSKVAAHTHELPLNTRDSGPQNPGPPPPSRPLYPPSEPWSVPPPPPPPGAPGLYPPPPLPPGSRPQQSLPPSTFPQAPLPAVVLNQSYPPPAAASSILANIMPGRDLRTLYRETWSDRPRFASYNWRDRLRTTGRRKSESNLDIYRETNEDSRISQHLPPNASKRMLVKSWKLAGHQIEQKSGMLSQRTGNDQPMQAIGATLGRMAERHLGLDLYSDTPQSMFVSHLLDTIEALHAERDFLEDLLLRPQEVRQPPVKAQEPSSVSKTVPEFKILHRVFCKSNMHAHDQSVFEDPPVRLFQERSQELALTGKNVIRNLDHYCSQNPNICFIVFQEYLCVEDTISRVRRDYSRRDQAGAEISPRAQRLCIVSDILQKALDHVALCYPLESRLGSRGMREMAAPYLFLYHHRGQLHQYEQKATGLVRENISLLLGFLKSDYDSEYREADTEFSKGILTSKHIEKLYRPNEIVIETSGIREMAYVVRDWPEIIENEMKVSCWSWQYDGMFLQRQDTVLKIKLPLPENYTKEKLPFCPISMASNTVIETLKERGRKFWSMKDQHFGCFSGLDVNRIQVHHHIRVIVDMFTYSKMHAARMVPPSMLDISRFDPWPSKIPREKELDDNMILLLPPTVFGFMLQEKQWMKLDISGIHPIEWNKRAFDRLVLDPKTKELITALVEVRISAGRAEDIIGGKGNGLMILLHGGPGTGKTLTAESVAEIAEKPLYRVTCGDIGTKADDVEKYLQTVLYLGKIWNCVLLLDEADIFLEERTIADLERNSLVSVFLRILEYYDGILIMTSNRVGTFDEAFKSRIQVSLHYEDLTKKARQTIWNNFIVMLEEAGEDVNISDLESHLEEIALEEMNGRQIRNAMTTARQLALHRKERLHWEHLDQVLKTAREFNRYLKNVQGHTDKQWAREQRLR